MKKLSRIAALLVLMAGPFLQAGVVLAAADTCTWTGTVNSSWSNGGNWSGCDNGGVPESGDALVFPDLASNKTNSNDLVGLDTDTIMITGSNYVFSGNDIQISPVSSTIMQISGDANDFGINLTINGTSSKSLSSSGSGNQISGDVVLNLTSGADMNVGSSNSNELSLLGVISGATDSFILNNANGSVTFEGANTFTAPSGLQINDGSTVRCGDAACLGNSANTLDMFGAAELILTSAMTFPYALAVNGGTGSPARIEALDDITFSAALDINADLTMQEGGSGYFEITSTAGTDIDAAATYTVEGGGNYLDSRFTIGGLTGSGDFIILASELDPGNNASFNGDIYFGEDSFINSPLDSHLGTSTGSTYFQAGSFMFYARSGITTVSENFVFEGTGNISGPYVGQGVVGNYSGSLDLAGTVTIADDTSFYNEVDTDTIIFSGLLAGTGDLTLTGDAIQGGYAISGTATNTLSGKITVDGLFLSLSKTAGLGIAGNVEVVANATNDARLNLVNAGGDQVADTSTINLINSAPNLAILYPEDGNEVVGMVTGDGVISQSYTLDTMTVGGGNLSGSFTGSFSNSDGDGTITKIGSGTWTLDGAVAESATNPVAFDIQEGSISWSGSLEQFTVSVSDGGVFKGTGSAGAVTVNSGGEINVGNSPGCMTLSSLSLDSGSIFTAELAGEAACTEYDQTTVTGTADITSATLSIDPTFTPTDGTVFTILTAGTLTGTFNGLANGDTVEVNGITFEVNYTSTSVTLTKVAGTLSQPTATQNQNTNTQAGLQDTGSSAAHSVIAGLGIIMLSLGLVRLRTKFTI